MKQKQSKKRTKTPTRRPVPIIIALLFVTIIVIVVAKLIVNSATPLGNSDAPLDNNSSQNTTTSTSSADIERNPNKEPIKYDGDDPNEKDSLTGFITTSRVSGNNYVIRVNIDQYLTSGSCELTFTNGEITHTDTAPIIPAASTSTCEGFDIPLKALSSGTYNIEINMTSSNKTGLITGEANI